MVWDYAEGNPFSESSGNFASNIEACASAIETLRPAAHGSASQADARNPAVAAVVATDPPYYDNIGYADLSDYFYVWLRSSLATLEPELFGTMVTPKSDELIATPYRHDGSTDAAEEYFEQGFIDVFDKTRLQSEPGISTHAFLRFQAVREGR